MVAEMIARRKKLGMSQAAFAKALGISTPMLSMIEDGKKLLPKELAKFIRRWLQTGQLPSGDELAARKTDNPGQ